MTKTEELAAAISEFNKLFDKMVRDKDDLDETARECLPDTKKEVSDALAELDEEKERIRREAREEEEFAIGDATDEIKNATDTLRYYQETVDCPRCKGALFDTIAVIAENAGNIEMSKKEARKIKSLKDAVTWLMGHRDRPDVAPVAKRMTDLCPLCKGRGRIPEDTAIPLDKAVMGCWIHRLDAASLRLVPDTPELYTKPMFDVGLLCRTKSKTGGVFFTAKFIEEHMQMVNPEDSPIEIDGRHYRLRKAKS